MNKAFKRESTVLKKCDSRLSKREFRIDESSSSSSSDDDDDSLHRVSVSYINMIESRKNHGILYL